MIAITVLLEPVIVLINALGWWLMAKHRSTAMLCFVIGNVAGIALWSIEQRWFFLALQLYYVFTNLRTIKAWRQEISK